VILAVLFNFMSTAHRHLRKDRLINGLYCLLVCLISTASGYYKKAKNALEDVTSSKHITKLKQSIFFRYLWYSLNYFSPTVSCRLVFGFSNLNIRLVFNPHKVLLLDRLLPCSQKWDQGEATDSNKHSSLPRYWIDYGGKKM